MLKNTTELIALSAAASERGLIIDLKVDHGLWNVRAREAPLESMTNGYRPGLAAYITAVRLFVEHSPIKIVAISLGCRGLACTLQSRAYFRSRSLTGAPRRRMWDLYSPRTDGLPPPIFWTGSTQHTTASQASCSRVARMQPRVRAWLLASWHVLGAAGAAPSLAGAAGVLVAADDQG